MKKWIYGTLLLLTAFVACRKDLEYTETTTIYPPGSYEYVKTSVGGRVVDETGAPVPGATVKLEGAVVKTDEYGVFNFRNLPVNSRGAYVRVEKPGFFHGSRTIIAAPGTRNTVKIQLLSNAVTRIVDVTSGGKADYGEYSVEIPKGGVVTASGVAYSGQIGVAAKWLNPVSDDFTEQMPGRLEGLTTENQLSGMISMGMLAVELTDPSGNKLQIADGHQATLRMKVPDQLLASAPASIPLWYFDEARGVWVEEGEATLNNGFYEGRVQHFSFWNHDYKAPLVEITFKVTDQNGAPVEGAKVYTQLLNDNQFGFGYTDNTGTIIGLVPQNEVLEAAIYLPGFDCAVPVLVQQIGPFAQNGSFEFVLGLIANSSSVVSGKLVDCDANPVSNGYVLINGLQEVFWVDAAGQFEITLATCATMSNVTLIAYDLAALKTSMPLVVDISSGTGDAGVISVCDPLKNYITYSFNGQTYVDTNPYFFVSDSSAVLPVDIKASSWTTTNNFRIQFAFEDISSAGSYPASYFTADGELNGNPVNHGCFVDCSDVTITLVEFNGQNGVLSGTFSGTLADKSTSPLQPVSISGAFRGILK